MVAGAVTGMWVPSMAPNTMGNPAIEWKSSFVLVTSMPMVGNLMFCSEELKTFVAYSIDLNKILHPVMDYYRII